MIRLDGRGLVPAIVQDANTGQVLMLGYMNPGSIKRTMEGGQVWFYSRSREELWQKGETSGNYLTFKEAHVDCDGDAILLKVDPTGPTCHTGNQSCFFNRLRTAPNTSRTIIRGPGYSRTCSLPSRNGSSTGPPTAIQLSCWMAVLRG